MAPALHMTPTPPIFLIFGGSSSWVFRPNGGPVVADDCRGRISVKRRFASSQIWREDLSWRGFAASFHKTLISRRGSPLALSTILLLLLASFL